MVKNILFGIIFISIKCSTVHADLFEDYKKYDLFYPCNKSSDGKLFMQIWINDSTKYWNGEIDLSYFPNLPEEKVNLTLIVDRSATIVVNQGFGRVNARGKNLFLTTYGKPPKLERLYFKVMGHNSLPQLKSVLINGHTVCEFAAAWISTVKENRLIDLNCGKRLVIENPLILTGDPTRYGDFPWHAALFRLKRGSAKYICGGSLINTQTVLTAAHCVHDYQQQVLAAYAMSVFLGKYNLRFSSPKTQTHEVFKIIPHDAYYAKTAQNDIAIIRLSVEARLSDYVQPICLWPEELHDVNDIIHEEGTIVGWGAFQTNNQVQVSNTLLQGMMRVIEYEKCLNYDREFFEDYLSDFSLCAESINDTATTCKGDSGSGFIFERNSTFYLRGIISFKRAHFKNENGTCSTKYPAVFVDVAKYLSWINENLI